MNARFFAITLIIIGIITLILQNPGSEEHWANLILIIIITWFIKTVVAALFEGIKYLGNNTPAPPPRPGGHFSARYISNVQKNRGPIQFARQTPPPVPPQTAKIPKGHKIRYQTHSTPIPPGMSVPGNEIYNMTWYHGTARENAEEIRRKNLWMIGKSEPHGIYITPKLEEAKTYPKHHPKPRAVLTLRLRKPLQIVKKGTDLYYVPAPPGTKPFKQYFHVPGIEITGIKYA